MRPHRPRRTLPPSEEVKVLRSVVQRLEQENQRYRQQLQTTQEAMERFMEALGTQTVRDMELSEQLLEKNQELAVLQTALEGYRRAEARRLLDKESTHDSEARPSHPHRTLDGS